MNITELESFFQSNTIPQQIQLNKSAKINDSSMFIATNLLRLSSYKGNIEGCPSYWHLMELYNVVKESMIRKEAF